MKRRGPSQRHFERQAPDQRLGDAGVQEDMYAQLTAVMGAIDDFLNQGIKGSARPWGIVVMMFPYGNVEGRCNYMSNGADRKDVVTLMKEMVARFEGQPDLKGSA